MIEKMVLFLFLAWCVLFVRQLHKRPLPKNYQGDYPTADMPVRELIERSKKKGV
jgi:hypothetical protein